MRLSLYKPKPRCVTYMSYEKGPRDAEKCLWNGTACDEQKCPYGEKKEKISIKLKTIENKLK